MRDISKHRQKWKNAIEEHFRTNEQCSVHKIDDRHSLIFSKNKNLIHALITTTPYVFVNDLNELPKNTDLSDDKNYNQLIILIEGCKRVLEFDVYSIIPNYIKIVQCYFIGDNDDSYTVFLGNLVQYDRKKIK